MDTTSQSLLQRLRLPNPQESWARFARLYTPLLFDWARRLGLQEPDAADLVQNVFVTLVKTLPHFQYNGTSSFRNWLYTVLRNQQREQLRRRVLPRAPEALLAEVADAGEPDLLEEEEYRHYLVNRALQVMQSQFAPKTWKACWEHVVNGRAVAEVAAELGISPGSVYVAKARVLTALRRELQGLLD